MPELSNRLEQVTAGNSSGNTKASSDNGNCIYYKVRKGDTLSSIARNKRTTVAKLQKWNNLRSTTIRVGQTLKIYR